MTNHAVQLCPTCDSPLVYQGADCVLAYGLGVIVSRTYHCPGCLQRHHIEVTDPADADPLAAALSNGDQR